MLKLERAEQVLLFLTLLFLPTQLGKHFWPPFSFVYSLPIDYLSPTIYLWDLLVILLCAVFILRKNQINRKALNLFFLFLLTQTLSLFSHPANIGVGLIRLEQLLLAGLFGVYIASAKKSWIRTLILWAFLLSITFESMLAIAQFVKNGTLGLWLFGERTFSISTPGIAKFDFYGRQFLRPYATFPHPNMLAAFMVLGIIILNPAKDLRLKMAVSAATILAGLTVLLTMSRVAMIVLFVAVAAISRKGKARILLAVAAITALPVLYARFSSLLSFDNLALLRREELSVAALRVWTANPILGVGLNNFILAASDLLLSGPSRFLQPVHNIFLLSLAETGVIGLTGLLILLGYPLFKVFKPSLPSYTRQPVLLLWGAIIFLGMFDHYFLTLPQGYRLLFFIWGLSINMLK